VSAVSNAIGSRALPRLGSVTPEDVAAAVQVEADTRDLVVGPVVREADRVRVSLSAAHESGRTAIIESNGVELFSLYLEQFHWPHFAHEEDDQRQLLRDLVSLAALHLFGGSTSRTERRGWRSEQVGLQIAWQGRTYFVTTKGVRPI
jgi:hypothetical protein